MKTIVSGNLAAAPVIATDKKGQEYLKFPLYEDQYRRNGDVIEKIQGKKNVYRVSVYDEKAKETAMQFAKGDRVEISGKFDCIAIDGKNYNMLRMYAGRLIFAKAAKASAESVAEEAVTVPAAEAEAAPAKKTRKARVKKAA